MIHLESTTENINIQKVGKKQRKWLSEQSEVVSQLDTSLRSQGRSLTAGYRALPLLPDFTAFSLGCGGTPFILGFICKNSVPEKMSFHFLVYQHNEMELSPCQQPKWRQSILHWPRALFTHVVAIGSWKRWCQRRSMGKKQAGIPPPKAKKQF